MYVFYYFLPRWFYTVMQLKETVSFNAKMNEDIKTLNIKM